VKFNEINVHINNVSAYTQCNCLKFRHRSSLVLGKKKTNGLSCTLWRRTNARRYCSTSSSAKTTSDVRITP